MPRVADIAQTEPNAEARTFAKNVRQMFAALMLEGFTETQSLHIIGVMLDAWIAQNGGGDGRAA